MIGIKKHKEQLHILSEKYHVEKLYIFGSAINSSFNPKSDIVLVEEQILRNPIPIDFIEKNKNLIYG